MGWYMFILLPVNDVGETNLKNLIRDLSQRYREHYLRDGEFPHDSKYILEGFQAMKGIIISLPWFQG